MLYIIYYNENIYNTYLQNTAVDCLVQIDKGKSPDEVEIPSL